MAMAELETVDGSLPDFSDLPDVTWVNIMHYLCLEDRAHVATTCHRLNDAFNHPSLWYSQKITFSGDSDNLYRSSAVIATPNVLETTRRFGKYYQNLTVTLTGHIGSMPKDLREILNEVTGQCRLETLSINAGIITSRFHDYGHPPNKEAVKTLTAFVGNAFRLKRLHVHSWPIFDIIDNSACNAFQALIQNVSLRETLECLTMFMLNKTDWSEREPKLISEELTMEVLQCFKYLTQIGLRTPMLNQSIMEMLTQPERAKLRLLQIVVHYLERPKFRIPAVPSHVWHLLVARNPEFRVEMTVLLRTPHIELANMLKPETPLSSLVYMKYSKVDPQTLLMICNNHRTTFKKLHCLCDAPNMDELLLELATKCEHMEEFVFHGNIRSTTVTAIAKLRGAHWKTFEVKKDNVTIPSEFDDDDEVIKRNRNGEIVLVGLMRFHQPEQMREQVLDAMTAEVSEALEYSWEPVKS